MDFTWIAVISLVILVLIALLVADYLFNGFKVTKKAIGWTPQLMNFRLGKVVWFIIICLFLFTPLWPQYLWPQIKWAWSSKDPEQRMWSTGFVNREGEEEWKLAITNKEDYLFELPKCTKFRFCNPHRVQKYYPNARSSGNPDAIEREVLYTDYEVSRGVGTYVDHKGVISYMNYFYMTPDPSVTDISKDTVTVWMKYKGELTNR